ncbi:MAG TPA: hypothetical protein PKB02_19010 [Anaerohalosphaeraceae bacterium]|nr:hypothetical protein [Anaerohalosphaeraceae bacterium]
MSDDVIKKTFLKWLVRSAGKYVLIDLASVLMQGIPGWLFIAVKQILSETGKYADLPVLSPNGIFGYSTHIGSLPYFLQMEKSEWQRPVLRPISSNLRSAGS